MHSLKLTSSALFSWTEVLKFIPMSDFFLDKVVITDRVLEIINPSCTQSDRQVALFRWWKNIRKSGGLRLSDHGNQAFLSADISYHDVLLHKASSLASNSLLRMEKFLLCPYYLIYTKTSGIVRLYDERVAVMIELHGSFEQYLQSLEVSRHQLNQM